MAKMTFAAFLLSLLIAAAFIAAPLGLSSDGTNYLVGARLLSRGEGYSLYQPGWEESYTLPQHHWPPGVSVALAVLLKVTGMSEINTVRAFQFTSWSLLCGSWILFYRKLLGTGARWLVATLLLFSQQGVWKSLTWVSSEVLFLAFLGLSALFLAQALSFKRDNNNQIFWVSMSALMMTAATLTRYAGIAFAFSSLVFFVICRRHFKPAAVLSYAVFVTGGTLAWLLRNRVLTGYYTLLDERDSYINLDILIPFDLVKGFVVSSLAIPVRSPILVVAIILLVIFLAWAVLKRMKDLREESSAALALWTVLGVVFSLGMLGAMVFLGKESSFWMRYFWPLQPFSVGLIVWSLGVLKNRFTKAGAAVLLCLIGLTGTARSLNAYQEVSKRSAVREGFFFQPFQESLWVYDWMRDVPQKNDLVVSNFPEFLSLMSDRPVTILPHKDAPESVEDLLKRRKPQGANVYFVISKIDLWKEYFYPWERYVQNLPHDVLEEDDASIIIRIRPEALGYVANE